jgi:hypothetical protein
MRILLGLTETSGCFLVSLFFILLNLVKFSLVLLHEFNLIQVVRHLSQLIFSRFYPLIIEDGRFDKLSYWFVEVDSAWEFGFLESDRFVKAFLSFI